MQQLKDMLEHDDVRGVVRSFTGEVIEFHHPGVKDLFNLIATQPHVLEGAYVADRVIGRGAALLLVYGHVRRVFAKLISEPALKVLQEAKILGDYDKVVSNIINREGTDVCPVEKLTTNINDPIVAFDRINDFLINKINIEI